MSHLPGGWVLCRVEDIFRSFSGGTPDRSNPEFWSGEIPWFSSGDIKSDTVEASSEFITREGLENSSAKLCPPGSVLVVVRSGILKHTLPVAISARRAAINQDIKCFDSGNTDLNRWLALALKNEARQILALNREGTTVQSVKYETLKRFELRLPPLNEQRRIVALLQELLAKVEACQKRLTMIPVILKRFRQSVLGAACSGRLTAEWRGSDNEEPGLPNGWERIPLEDLLENGGIFDGPFGSNLKTEDYAPSGVRVVRLENIGHLRFFGDKETYITKEKYGSLKKHTVGYGDIIFSSFIADEIRACLLPQLETKAIAKADCFCLRPDRKAIDPRYLTFQLVSQESYNKLIDSVHGATRPRINTTQLRKLQIRICPLQEQREIVSCVDALFKFADQIEARYKKAQAQVDKLTQSILAKAFRGELAPTEAELARREGRDYEPASTLLNRVLKDRAQPAGRTKARRATRRIRQ